MENKEPKKVLVTEVTFTQTVESVGLPDKITGNFKRLEDWLVNLCVSGDPKKPISTYDIGVFESDDDTYVVYLVGLNTYGNRINSIIKIDFQPLHRFYQLQRDEMGNLSRPQVFAKLTGDLKRFTKSQEFKSSFLAQASLIKTSFSGIIWAKYTSFEDWLINLCASENPKTSISTYSIGISDSRDGSYEVYLIGLNTHGDSTNPTIKIDFQPINRFYHLRDEVGNLSREQVCAKLTDDLKRFIKSQEFKNSFLAQANLIKTYFSGTIWTNGEHTSLSQDA